MNIATIVLSAGKGTRMNSDIPKVLHKVLGKEIILWSKDSVKNFKDKFFVIGHKQELVEKYISGDAEIVIQEEQLGTGHALSVVLNDKKFLSKEYDYLLVLPGDVPLIEEKALSGLVEKVVSNQAAVGFIVASVSNPFGYGRVIIDEDKNVIKIVEEKDASDEEKKINIINSGIYCFDYKFALENILELDTDNKQNEVYLTDLIGLASSKKQKILVEESSDCLLYTSDAADE